MGRKAGQEEAGRERHNGQASSRSPAPQPNRPRHSHSSTGAWPGEAAASDGAGKGTVDIEDARRRAYRDALCRAFFDLRAFGGVDLNSRLAEGQFLRPGSWAVAIRVRRKLDRVLQLDATITRCAVASERKKETDSEDAEETGNRLWAKHVVNYGLYRTHIYFSPAFAAKTGFTYYDLDNFFFALQNMFRDDTAAGRAECGWSAWLISSMFPAWQRALAQALRLVKVARTPESKERNADSKLVGRLHGLARTGTCKRYRRTANPNRLSWQRSLSGSFQKRTKPKHRARKIGWLGAIYRSDNYGLAQSTSASTACRI